MSAALVATAPERAASARILRAATALFRARGYHGSSMRTLARGLRMEPASLYYHFPSKQDILFAILDRTLDDLLDGLRHAVTAADDDRARLLAAVRFHVLFHVRRRQEAFLRTCAACSPSATNTSTWSGACSPPASAPAASRWPT